MLPRALLNQIVCDESLGRGLGDAEARLLVEWLVERAEESARQCGADGCASVVKELSRRGRALRRFVHLWCYEDAPGAALQLAAVEQFAWPLPKESVDAYHLMQDILAWEEEMRPLRAA